MRLYSIYEIEKITGGRLTKYRLLRAIEEGSLKAVEMETVRRGRGAPRFLIAEDVFINYLQSLRSDFGRRDMLSNDEITEIVSKLLAGEKNDLSESDKAIQTLMNRLHTLEAKNAVMEPLVRQGMDFMTEEKRRSILRKELLDALIGTEWFEFEKRKSLVEKLDKLS